MMKYIITFNGAIYNYKDLWFKLTGKKGNTQNSDIEFYPKL